MRLEVFEHMCLVKNHVIPRLAFENEGIPTGKRIGSDANVKMVLLVPSLTKFLSTFRAPVVAEDLESREELFELHFPIKKNAGGNNLGDISNVIEFGIVRTPTMR